MSWKKNILLSPKQNYWNLLSFLYTHSDELITKTQCKKHLTEMSENTASYQLDTLIEANVLTVRRHPHDKRAVVVSLSPNTEAELDTFFASFEIKFKARKASNMPGED